MASDILAFGIVLHELLTQERPLDGILRAIRQALLILCSCMHPFTVIVSLSGTPQVPEKYSSQSVFRPKSP